MSLDELRREHKEDPYLATVMEALRNGTPPPGLTCQLKSKRLSLQQGVLYADSLFFHVTATLTHSNHVRMDMNIMY